MRYCGAGMLRPFSSVKRRLAYIGASSPVTQTSPSPCTPCASPVENSAPGTCTGRNSVVPWLSWRVSMLPPNVPGGITGCALGAGGADAHRAEERVERDRRRLRAARTRRRRCRTRAGRRPGTRPASSPSPGRIAVQPQPSVWMSSTSTASVSPGSAPSTAIGPASGYTRSQSSRSMSLAWSTPA